MPKIYCLICSWRTCVIFPPGRSSAPLTHIMHWKGLLISWRCRIITPAECILELNYFHLFIIQVYQSKTVQLTYSPFILSFSTSAERDAKLLNFMFVLKLPFNPLKSLIQILKNKQAKKLDSIMIHYNVKQSQPKCLLNA